MYRKRKNGEYMRKKCEDIKPRKVLKSKLGLDFY